MISQVLDMKIDKVWDALNDVNVQAANDAMVLGIGMQARETIKARNAIEKCLTIMSEIGNAK